MSLSVFGALTVDEVDGQEVAEKHFAVLEARHEQLGDRLPQGSWIDSLRVEQLRSVHFNDHGQRPGLAWLHLHLVLHEGEGEAVERLELFGRLEKREAGCLCGFLRVTDIDKRILKAGHLIIAQVFKWKLELLKLIALLDS